MGVILRYSQHLCEASGSRAASLRQSRCTEAEAKAMDHGLCSLPVGGSGMLFDYQQIYQSMDPL